MKDMLQNKKEDSEENVSDKNKEEEVINFKNLYEFFLLE